MNRIQDGQPEPSARRVLFSRYAGVLAWIATLAVASSAIALDYAPIDRPGPPLSVAEAELRASLACTPDFASDERAPVLLAPGTTLTPEENFDWNYAAFLKAEGWPYCTLTMPNRGMSDIQVTAEYAVFAIREMSRQSGKRIKIIGYSQGAHVPRWALRFWPDTRPLVDEMIGIAPPNHGSQSADPMCVRDCAESTWQQTFNSNYMRALNSHQETFSEISYTMVYSETDEFARPPKETSTLEGGANVSNIATQDACPLNTADHLAIGTYDPVAFAVVWNAVTQPGPARLEEVPTSVCAEVFMPGVDPVTFPEDYATLAAVAFATLATYPRVPDEPPLKPYVLPEPAPMMALMAGASNLIPLHRRRVRKGDERVARVASRDRGSLKLDPCRLRESATRSSHSSRRSSFTAQRSAAS